MATAPYADVEDVEARLGRTMSQDEADRATTLIADATVYVDLNLPECVDKIQADFPGLIESVIAEAVIRKMETPTGDVQSVRVGEASLTYMRQRSTSSTSGLLNDSDLDTLRKACGQASAGGLHSVPITTAMAEATSRWPSANGELQVVNGYDPSVDGD